jgi:cytochrome o ubiquinol oxidase subunit 2
LQRENCLSCIGHRSAFGALAAVLPLAPCSALGVTQPGGPIAAAERLILIDATAIMLVVVVPVIVLTCAFAWRYRASNTDAAYRPDWAYSGQIELVVWSIPAMVVILLSGVGWIGSHELDPARPLDSPVAPLRIEAVSLDWKWLFIYPDQRVASVNELTVPVGTPLEFTLTSATVMNAFFIPQLGSQIYAMPGMADRLNLLADRPGDYVGFSSHFSGDGFADMRFVVHAVPAKDYRAWLGQVRGAGDPLGASAYAALARAGTVQPTTYREADPDLFGRIVGRTVGASDLRPD